MSNNPLTSVTHITERKRQTPEFFAQLERNTEKLNLLIAKSNALLSDVLRKENDTEE